jgi:hypothetical protein
MLRRGYVFVARVAGKSSLVLRFVKGQVSVARFRAQCCKLGANWLVLVSLWNIKSPQLAVGSVTVPTARSRAFTGRRLCACSRVFDTNRVFG